MDPPPAFVMMYHRHHTPPPPPPSTSRHLCLLRSKVFSRDELLREDFSVCFRCCNSSSSRCMIELNRFCKGEIYDTS
ncbi:hypothetical protein TYRP_003937 [Tyrophagus putrescentiae]|nr:hypothetical protein TYRP_003937 [Tyrophagus putrescentiae]